MWSHCKKCKLPPVFPVKDFILGYTNFQLKQQEIWVFLALIQGNEVDLFDMLQSKVHNEM